MFPKVAQKVASAEFTLKSAIYLTLPNILATIVRKFVAKTCQK